MSQEASTRLSKALDALETEYEQLIRLENFRGKFNIFDALGAVRSELRHSSFLAFLLDPKESHGLGDSFLRRFVDLLAKQVSAGSAAILGSMELSGISVRREWNRVDVLLLNDKHKIAIIIENKVGTHEHSNQLSRYWESIGSYFKGYSIFGIYLTPYGETPSHESYVAISYANICAELKLLLTDKGIAFIPDVTILIEHYIKVVERSIIVDAPTVALRQNIASTTKQVLELRSTSTTDRRFQICSYLHELIRDTEGFNIDIPDADHVRFLPVEWDIPSLMRPHAHGWTSSRRLWLFEFQVKINPSILRLKLTVGPPPPEESRELLLKMAEENNPPFSIASKSHSWYRLYDQLIISGEQLNQDLTFVKEHLRSEWVTFLTRDLSRMKEIVQNQPWFA